jgi:hypothetical protein
MQPLPESAGSPRCCGRLTSQILLPLLLALFATTARADTDSALQARIQEAVARGLDWIQRHPATLRDGGLPDLLDEGVGFMMLSSLSGENEARERFGTMHRGRMAALGKMPEFAQWAMSGRKRLTDHYHLVLAAHLMRQAGSPSALQPEIVSRARQVLTATPRADPTKRLTIALFLQQLGADAGISIEAALAAGRIERVAGENPPALPPAGAGPQQRLAASLHLYALVHEIIALTDFGRQPAPDWLLQRREPLNRFLINAIAWAGRAGNVDLMSELLLTARFLDAPLQSLSPEVLQHLLDSQQEDGRRPTGPTSCATRSSPPPRPCGVFRTLQPSDGYARIRYPRYLLQSSMQAEQCDTRLRVMQRVSRHDTRPAGRPAGTRGPARPTAPTWSVRCQSSRT